MVKKSVRRSRLTSADRHEQVIERLARIETQLEGLPKVVEKVERLEAHRNWFAGALAVLSAVFTAALAIFHGK